MAIPTTYVVIAPKPVVVEDGGTAISYPPGAVFTASPNNTSIMRLLESDQIRPGSGPAQTGGYILVAGPAGPPGPPGPAASLSSVLTAGNTAAAGQKLRFNLGDGDTTAFRAGTWNRDIGYGATLPGEGLLISVAGEDILAVSHETDDGASGFDPVLTMPVDSAFGWTASASVTADHIASFGFYDTPANGHELYFTAPRFAFFEGPVNGATAQRLVLDNGVWDFGTNYLAFSAAFDGTGPSIRAGANSPEGVVSAAVGSIFLRSNGASGTTVYTKVSGSGNTGWEVLGGGSANNLAATLAAGNTTGGNNLVLTAGDSLYSAPGAELIIHSGDAVAADMDGDQLIVRAGHGTGTATGGLLLLKGGNSGQFVLDTDGTPLNIAGTPSELWLSGGDSINGAGFALYGGYSEEGVSHDCFIESGTVGPNATAGNLNIKGGDCTGGAGVGAAGSVVIRGGGVDGAGKTPGLVQIFGADGIDANCPGGNVEIIGGLGQNAQAGHVIIRGGDRSIAGAGGNVYLDGGEGLAGTEGQVIIGGDAAKTSAVLIGAGGGSQVLGFFGGGGAAQATVSGSRGGNAALAALLTALADYGLIVDNTTA